MDDGRRERRHPDRLSALAASASSRGGASREAAAEALAIMGSDLDPDAPVSSLPAAERSLVAIGRALAIKADILVLDEPTAALPEADVERLLDDAEAAARERHRHRLCHPSPGRGVPHRRPRHRSSRRPAARDRPDARHERGRPRADDRRPLDERRVRQARAGVATACALTRPGARRRSASVPSRFRSPQAKRSGLSGCAAPAITRSGGRSSARRASRRAACMLDGEPIAPKSPAEAMAQGIGFVSSRRAEEGIAANLAVRENIYLNPAASGKGVLEFDLARERARARPTPRRGASRSRRRASKRRPRRCRAETSRRWSSRAGWRRRARLLILEEPTIGVDVGAKAEIYHLLQLSLSRASRFS